MDSKIWLTSPEASAARLDDRQRHTFAVTSPNHNRIGGSFKEPETGCFGRSERWENTNALHRELAPFYAVDDLRHLVQGESSRRPSMNPKIAWILCGHRP
jgi:hypothetical protein